MFDYFKLIFFLFFLMQRTIIATTYFRTKLDPQRYGKVPPSFTYMAGYAILPSCYLAILPSCYLSSMCTCTMGKCYRVLGSFDRWSLSQMLCRLVCCVVLLMCRAAVSCFVLCCGLFLARWYNSVLKLKMHAVVFYDSLPDSFVRLYETDLIKSMLL